MIALPRERGKSRRYVYGRTPEQAVARFNKAIGAGSARVRPGSISEFFVDEYWPWQTSRPPAPNHFERHLESVCKAAGVHITPHDLRAAAICRLIDAGASDHEIQEIVGHADREMIEWYRDRSAERSRSGLARLVSSDNQLG